MTKSALPETFVAAVREIAAGRRFFGPDVATALARDRFAGAASPLAALTPRELEILRLLAEGASAPAIADALCLSPKTVRYGTSITASGRSSASGPTLSSSS